MTQRLRPSKQPKPLTRKEKWAYWINSWRWSSIKAQYKKEYSRVHGNAEYLISKADEKVRGKD